MFPFIVRVPTTVALPVACKLSALTVPDAVIAPVTFNVLPSNVKFASAFNTSVTAVAVTTLLLAWLSTDTADIPASANVLSTHAELFH